ncbi:MAG: hypothetical protein M1396_00605 [Chloroflexi bacterium]|nr:hypothetical protein [Chloroflexota bacterium]
MNVDRTVTKELDAPETVSRSVTWLVQSIHSGSPVTMTLRARPASDEAPISAAEDIIIRSVSTGLATIESAAPLERLPHYFDFPTLEHIRDLIRTESDGVTGITVITPDQTISLSSATERNVERFLRPVYENYSSVEGTIQMVAVSGQNLHFSVRDRLSERSIQCIVPKSRQPEVLAVFDQRVIVEGRVRVNRRGDVLAIKMERLIPFLSDDQLPDIEDVAGAFDLTGDKSVAEHLERLRDAS